MTNAALFSKPDQASLYSLHRPTYPRELYAAIVARCSQRSLAVDIATGSGQAATALAGHFDRVIAQDGSTAQLEHADRQHSNIEYQQADAHSTGLPDHCADLVTVAQALHWFDCPRFYREVRRVLRPGGCFAAWTYALPMLCHEGHPANAVLWQLFDGVLGPYWAAGRKHVEAGYVGSEPVAGQDFGSVERLTFDSTRTARVDDVVRALHTLLSVAAA
jgi:ubiquinone/menaquinone biosynthesis C-methylase UbiE